MPLYIFHCPEHEIERLASRTTTAILCPHCGKTAVRQEVNHIGVTGFAAVPRDQKSYRQSFKEFKEASAEVDYHYSKAEANGDPVKSPNLFQAGLAQARKQGFVDG